MRKAVVVLPTLNEKTNLRSYVGKVLDQEKNLPDWRIEVLISDSQSTDGTEQLAQEMAKEDKRVHFLSVGKGLGVGLIEAHRYSLKYLKPDVLAQIDADGQVEVDVIVRLIKAIEAGYDLALGSRFVEGGKNNLSFSRRLFSKGASWVFRVLIGPYSIKEITNSARAFTPQLFKNINLSRVPWKERRSFIVQPAFLHEALEAGAKYIEVPLVFKNRAEGYSKNKVANYTYDFFAYALDVRFRKLGLNIPVFDLSRRLKTLIKFGTVGVTGTAVDFIVYNIVINYLSIPPATSRLISVPAAILNNFLLNNYWTFKHRNNNSKFTTKLILFYLVSLGGVAIAVLATKFLHSIYGDGVANVFGLPVAYYNVYFLVTIFPVLIWNFTVNQFITWRKQPN